MASKNPFPAIPDLTQGSKSLESTVRALRECVEILTGQRGSGDNRAVRYLEYIGSDQAQSANPFVDLVQIAEAAITQNTIGSYNDLTDIPTSFPPAAHTHIATEITDLASVLAAYAALAGAVFTGRVTLPASNSTEASLNLVPGTEPTTPADGDIWTEVDGVYAYLNFKRQGPIGRFKNAGTLVSTGADASLSFTGLERYNEIVVRVQGLSGATAAAQLLCRLSADGVTYDSTGYVNYSHGQIDAAVPAGYATDVALTSAIGANGTVLSAAAGTVNAVYHLYGFNDPTVATFGTFDIANASAATRGHWTGNFNFGTAREDQALQFLWSAGNIDAGQITLLGR